MIDKKNKIILFENTKIRTVWDEENQKWLFFILDIIGVLTDQTDFQKARNYWKVLKFRLKKEGNESVTDCNQLKMKSSDDKMGLSNLFKSNNL